MAEYLIQEETLIALADQARRLSNTTDTFNVSEILETFSKVQGAVNNNGDYLVEAFDIDHTDLLKYGLYNTGEIFAIPKAKNFDNDEIGRVFKEWTSDSPISDNFVVVENKPIQMAAIWDIKDQAIVLQILTSEALGTTISFEYLPNSAVIDWGDGNVETVNGSCTHSYSDYRFYIIKMYGINYFYDYPCILPDQASQNMVRYIYFPSSFVYRGYNMGAVTYIPPYVETVYIASDEILTDSTTDARLSFNGKTALKYIWLPKGITSIDYRAFYECSNLQEIIIPYGVTSIGYQAFYNCTSLKKIIIPDSVTSIGDEAFCNCTSLTALYMSAGVTSFSHRCIANNNLIRHIKDLVLPSVTTIENDRILLDTENLVLGAESVCTISSISRYGVNTNIYVPDNLVDAYKTSDSWEYYTSLIKPMSEYIPSQI